MPPKEGFLHCGKELKCVGRKDSGWEGLEVCIEEKYKCDGTVQCEGGEDEIGCSEEATGWCHYERCNKFYKQPSGGDCGEKLKCIARDGKFVGGEVCFPSDFICDNMLQCQGGEDEDNCEAKYIEKKIFTVDEEVVCTSRSLNLTKIGNGTGTGHFYPYRGGLFNLQTVQKSYKFSSALENHLFKADVERCKTLLSFLPTNIIQESVVMEWSNAWMERTSRAVALDQSPTSSFVSKSV